MKANYADSILDTLLQSLEKNDHTASGELTTIKTCLDLCSAAIQQLDQAILKNGFDNPEDEIHFFKYQRPQIDGRLLYYVEVLRIGQDLATTGLDDRVTFFRHELRRIQEFYQHNRELYLYYRLQFDYLDQVYFLRAANAPVTDLDSARLAADRRVVALKSPKYGAFIAHELLQQYLDRQLFAAAAAIDNQQNVPERVELRWTGTLSGLTELIYGLNEMAVFNSKKMDIARLADFFSHVFHVNLSSIYKLHENNRLRKKSRTPFLDNTVSALLRKYDYDDEFALG